MNGDGLGLTGWGLRKNIGLTAWGLRLTGLRLAVCGATVLTIASLGAPRQVSAQASPQWQDIIRNLRHPDVKTRLDAVGNLGRAAYGPAADSVAMLVTDGDDRVQLAAIDAELSFFLADRPDGGFSSRAQAAFETGTLVRAAAAAPPVLTDRLIAAMRDENARVRFDAVHALGFIVEAPLAPEHARALIAELDHYDSTMRAATARVLGRLRVRQAGDALLAGLEDSSTAVRLFAVEALGLIGEPRVAPAARSLVRGKGDLAAAGMLALARLATRDDIELFRQSLIDKDARVRRAAAEGLGRAGDAASVETLATLMQSDKSDAVRLAAAFALQKLGQTQTHVIASMLVLPRERGQARDYLLEIGRPALPGIESALKVATDGRHRADLVRMIGFVGTRDDRAMVEGLQQDRDERVRRAAATASARLQR